MSIEFHDTDDICAPFPHRVIIKEERLAQKRITPHKVVIEILPEVRFIICAHCDHWIMGGSTSCPCRNRCHDYGQMIAEQARQRVDCT